MIETFNKLDTGEMHLNTIKAMYHKTTAKVILTGLKLNTFPLRSGTMLGCQLFNILLGVTTTGPQQKSFKF